MTDPRGRRRAGARRAPSAVVPRSPADAAALGVFVKSPDPNIAEILVRAGYDFLLADLEHSTLGLADVASIARTADLGPVPVVARLSVDSLSLAGRLLDSGVGAVQIADVTAVDAGRLARRAVSYPPRGARGLSLSQRSASFGFQATSAHLAEAEAVGLIAQIESAEGVAALPQLLSAGDFDAYFLGPTDLAISLGAAGRSEASVVQEHLQRAAELILGAGLPLGVFAQGGDDARRWRETGASMIAIGSDLSLLARAASADLDATALHEAEPIPVGGHA